MPMRRIYVDDRTLMAMRLFFRDFGIWHVIGAHSISVPSMQTKIVVLSVCKPWVGLDGREVLMTPGEAARVELERAFPDLKRVGWPGPLIKLFDKRVPYHFTGPISRRELFYVDLEGAYYQIYRCLALDTCYPCGRGLLSLAGVGEALKPWKQARNSVIGVCRSRSATGIKGGRVHRLSTSNRYLSPSLWATVVGVLQHLAAIAVGTGDCGYINTDGYIFQSEDSFDFFTSLLRAWGIAFHTQRGEGEVTGWGCYEVGGKRAGRRGNRSAVGKPFSTLEAPYPGLFAWFIRQKERLDNDPARCDGQADLKRSFVFRNSLKYSG